MQYGKISNHRSITVTDDIHQHGMVDSETRDAVHGANITMTSSNIGALMNAMQSFQQQQIKVMTEQHREEMISHEQSYQTQAEEHREKMA